jgi:hypothetical protein
VDDASKGSNQTGGRVPRGWREGVKVTGRGLLVSGFWPTPDSGCMYREFKLPTIGDILNLPCQIGMESNDFVR